MTTAMRWIMGGIALVTFCMLIAILGRVWDWSPFALVVSGAVLGFAVAVGLTVLVYETDEPAWGADPCAAPSLTRLFACTRPRGHDGDHIAGGTNGVPLHRWAR